MLIYKRTNFNEVEEWEKDWWYQTIRERRHKKIREEMEKRFPEWDKRRIMWSYMERKGIEIGMVGKEMGTGFKEVLKELYRGISIEFAEAIERMTGDNLSYLVQAETKAESRTK